jgi:hypothetical protein
MMQKTFISLALVLNLLLFGCNAFAQMPPITLFESKVATVFAEEGRLTFEIQGFYINNEINPEYYLEFQTSERCSETHDGRTCGQAFLSYNYESFSGLINALEAGLHALHQEKDLSTTFKLCDLKCRGVPTRALVVKSEKGIMELTVDQTSSSTYSLSLDEDSGYELFKKLKYGVQLQNHWASQFKAFNAAKPDEALPVLPEEQASAADETFNLPAKERPVGAWVAVRGGAWNPSPDQLAEIKTRIELFVKSQAEKEGRELPDWSSYSFQYRGMQRIASEVLLIHASCRPLPASAKMRWVMVLGGGSCFFQVNYDPETKQFSHLQFNAPM